MKLYSYKNKMPEIGNNCFIAPNATIIGDVIIGDNCSIWFGSVIRADVNSITIGNNTNIQDNSVVHCNTEKPTSIGNNVTAGHGTLIHACDIKDNVLIGNRSVIHDHAIVNSYSIIAPGAVVVDKTVVPEKSLYVGIPAKLKREITQKDLEKIKTSTQRYLSLKDKYLSEFR